MEKTTDLELATARKRLEDLESVFEIVNDIANKTTVAANVRLEVIAQIANHFGDSIPF